MSNCKSKNSCSSNICKPVSLNSKQHQTWLKFWFFSLPTTRCSKTIFFFVISINLSSMVPLVMNLKIITCKMPRLIQNKKYSLNWPKKCIIIKIYIFTLLNLVCLLKPMSSCDCVQVSMGIPITTNILNFACNWMLNDI